MPLPKLRHHILARPKEVWPGIVLGMSLSLVILVSFGIPNAVCFLTGSSFEGWPMWIAIILCLVSIPVVMVISIDWPLSREIWTTRWRYVRSFQLSMGRSDGLGKMAQGSRGYGTFDTADESV